MSVSLVKGEKGEALRTYYRTQFSPHNPAIRGLAGKVIVEKIIREFNSLPLFWKEKNIARAKLTKRFFTSFGMTGEGFRMTAVGGSE